MCNGGYVIIKPGKPLYMGGGIRNTKLYNQLEYARKHGKPIVMEMWGIEEIGTDALPNVTNFVNYIFYPEGIDRTKEPAYILSTFYHNENLELKTRWYWVKKEEEN